MPKTIFMGKKLSDKEGQLKSAQIMINEVYGKNKYKVLSLSNADKIAKK
jgi:hypothetical protein